MMIMTYNDDADDNEDAMIGKNKKSNINNCIRSNSYYCGDDIYDDTKLQTILNDNDIMATVMMQHQRYNLTTHHNKYGYD